MSINRTISRLAAAVVVIGLGATGCASINPQKGSGGGSGSGEAWAPSGDVTMVVPFKAGGGSDLSGRAMGSGLEKAVPGLTVKVENRDGGSGAVGYSYFMSKKGDPNYVLATETALLALPLTQKVEFSHKTFTPIMKVGEDFTLAVVPKDSPWTTCADLVEAGKSGRVVTGISGRTGLDNIVFTLTEQATGTKFDRVPFESGSELLAALLGGQVQVASLNPGEIIGQLESGDVKPLCAFADQRYTYEELKDIPTAKEQGIDVSFAQFRGLLAPGEISEEEKAGWIEAGKKFAESPEYSSYIEENYMQPTQLYGEEFSAYLAENSTELEKVVKTQ